MINIIIADHQAIFRAGVAKILAVEDDLRIVGQPQSAEQLTNSLDKLRTKVLVISSGFGCHLPEILAVAKKQQIAVMVLAEGAEAASKYMGMGVQGVVYRSIPGESMVEAVRRLSRGETYVQIANITPPSMGEDAVGIRVRDRLSDKEIKIMAAVIRGYKNRDIALQLYTTEQVVKNALRNIFDKTGVSDRLELALFVLHHRTLAQATATVHLQPEFRRKRRTVANTGSAARQAPPLVQ